VYTPAVTHVIATQNSADITPLPASTLPPEPTPASVATEAPLPSHQVFGFAPYWTLPQSGDFDVAGLTTLAYFSVDVSGNGTLDQNGSGWSGFESQAFTSLENRAHSTGDRVVLTVTCFDQSALNQLTSDPTAPSTLATGLISALEDRHLDGVNLDFEGTGSADQIGLTRLVSYVSGALRAVDANWQITMDTYASSAGDPGGFYNIAALAPSVDAFFVMSYSLNLSSSLVASSPLTSAMFSDTTAVEEYLSAVPASKVMLGLPFFGYTWPTSGPALGDPAVGAAVPVADAQVVAEGSPLYWDAATDTAWTSYQVGSQWYQSFYEDATSLYMAAELAADNDLAGDGIWALGMDGSDPAMLAAVDGSAPAVKDLPAGPVPSTAVATTTTSAVPTTTTSGVPTTTTTATTTATTTTTTTAPRTSTTASGVGTTTTSGPTYSYSAEWQGSTVALIPLGANALKDEGDRVSAGTISGFTTDDPTMTCLENAASLQVVTYTDQPGIAVVLATSPGDCITTDFFFPTVSGTSG
jgi:hypothetical protein